MIGDDLEADIAGARNFGIDQVYFNPEKIPHSEKAINREVHATSKKMMTYEIAELNQLHRILKPSSFWKAGYFFCFIEDLFTFGKKMGHEK